MTRAGAEGDGKGKGQGGQEGAEDRKRRGVRGTAPSVHGARELGSVEVPLISEKSRSFRRVASRRDAMARLPGARAVRVRTPSPTPRPAPAALLRHRVLESPGDWKS